MWPFRVIPVYEMIEMYSGMRMGEINALRLSDIDLDAGTISIHSTISVGMDNKPYVKDGAKTSRGNRKIPISKSLQPYLIEALERQIPNELGLLFCDINTGMPLRTSQVSAYFSRICRKAGIGPRGQHALRHTFATRCIEAGVSPVVLKTWLGHSDIHVTLDTYTDVYSGMNGQAVSKYYEYLMTMYFPDNHS